MVNLEKEFFNFSYQRQLIWYKRFILKQNPPWTNDEVLKKYKIINMYRELDRCTIYIVNKLKRISNRKKVLLNIIFYRFFNKDRLYEKLGIVPFEKVPEKLKEKFSKLKEIGEPIFNNAYLISSGKKGVEKHKNILRILQELNLGNIISEIDNSKTPRESLEILQKIPMIGPFLACEIWTDLTYFNFFKQKWNDNDFVNIGPGAKWGLEIIYNKKLNKKEQKEKLQHLYKIQKEFLKKAWDKIAYKEAYSNYPFLSITNIEGALCEFRKYWRLKQNKGKRRYFAPNTSELIL